MGTIAYINNTKQTLKILHDKPSAVRPIERTLPGGSIPYCHNSWWDYAFLKQTFCLCSCSAHYLLSFPLACAWKLKPPVVFTPKYWLHLSVNIYLGTVRKVTPFSIFYNWEILFCQNFDCRELYLFSLQAQMALLLLSQNALRNCSHQYFGIKFLI